MSDTPTVSGSAGSLAGLPLLRGERVWGFWGFTSVNVGLAIATWAFLTGGSVALFVGAKAAIAVTVVGNLVGVVLVALTTCVPSAKYGVEQFGALRSVFGRNGVRILLLLLMPFLLATWNAILAIMFGRALANVSNAVLGTDLRADSPVVIGFCLVALVACWLLLLRGPLSLSRVNGLIAPALAVITLVMLVVILRERGPAELAALAPLTPLGDPLLSYTAALEVCLGAGFSWWAITGNLARLTTTARVAYWPNLIGLFGASTVAGLVGTLAALAFGSSDPTTWMVPVGGVVLGALALLFVAFANVTSILGQTYSGALAVQRLHGAIAHLPWPVLAALLLLPATVMVFFPGGVYELFFRFLALVALIVAPLCAVYFADFYLLRRRRLHLRDLYTGDEESRYGFWQGINPVAFVAVAAGAVTYLLLLNPVTYASSPLFPYLTASLPAFAVTAAVHVVLTKAIVRPLNRGGYR
ncbi:cytosine permease [Nocardiopsis sp. FIRDI 009]|uniref:cytosine permease n=1 Tax=Nocardiopsis sp. FIRDI 009 TaxID=714197 RepID=UPI000E25945E|nr:cytosine permease [Nocardiopsis sp. FIRDI 009]